MGLAPGRAREKPLDQARSTIAAKEAELQRLAQELRQRLEAAERAVAQKDAEMRQLIERHQAQLDALFKAGAERDREISELEGRQAEQAAMLDKLAYINEELEAQVRELMASRWRRLGIRLRLAKPASFER